MSFITQFINRLFPKSDEQYQLTIVGLDYSGKTSLLCLLKEAQLPVTTAPPPRFNTEEFVAPTTSESGDKVPMIGWDIGTGCGGLTNMMGILETYIRYGDALVWMVDSTDKERLSESDDKLQHFVSVLAFKL